jgi:hypothetical protein
MPMSSLKERIEWLERELPPNPPRFKIHEDLPFAILRYDPTEEWDVRREVRLLATRLEAKGRPVTVISLAELLWEAIDENEGIDAVGALERERGFEAAQEQVNTYLSDDDFTPLPRLVAERLNSLDPERDLAFLVRAASLAPAVYHISKLLDELQGRTRVPTILFYPGEPVGTNSLRFMGLTSLHSPPSYRVKIYG